MTGKDPQFFEHYEVLKPIGGKAFLRTYEVRDTQEQDPALELAVVKDVKDPDFQTRDVSDLFYDVFTMRGLGIEGAVPSLYATATWIAQAYVNAPTLWRNVVTNGVRYSVREAVQECQRIALVLQQASHSKPKLESTELIDPEDLEFLEYVRSELNHEYRICHFALSPKNIFLGRDGKVWIKDWVMYEKHLHLASDFTEAYAFQAPEVLDMRSPDERADIYSLGLVIAFAVTAEISIKERIRAGHGIPKELMKLIASWIEEKPERRPADWAEAIKQMDDFLASGVDARAAGGAITLGAFIEKERTDSEAGKDVPAGELPKGKEKQEADVVAGLEEELAAIELKVMREVNRAGPAASIAALADTIEAPVSGDKATNQVEAHDDWAEVLEEEGARAEPAQVDYPEPSPAGEEAEGKETGHAEEDEGAAGPAALEAEADNAAKNIIEEVSQVAEEVQASSVIAAPLTEEVAGCEDLGEEEAPGALVAVPDRGSVRSAINKEPREALSISPTRPDMKKVLHSKALYIIVALLAFAGLAIGARALFSNEDATTTLADIRTLPSLAGMSMEEAQRTADSEGITLVKEDRYSSEVAEGKIMSQDPGEGVEIADGMAVTIIMSLGPEPAPEDLGVGETVGTGTTDQAAGETTAAGSGGASATTPAPAHGVPHVSVSASPSSGPSSGVMVSLSASASVEGGSIVSYSWSCGGSGPHISREFASAVAPTTITITCTVTDDLGQTASESASIKLY
jgi:hypothetical protein